MAMTEINNTREAHIKSKILEETGEEKDIGDLKYEYLKINMKIKNAATIETKKILMINVEISWGKFWMYSPSNEIYPATIMSHAIDAESTYHLNACGRAHSTSGTMGRATLIEDRTGATEIARIEWNVPYSGKTSFSVTPMWDKWSAVHDWVEDSGASVVNTTITLTPFNDS